MRENRTRLAASIGRDPTGVVMARQVHGSELRAHEAPQEPRVYADVVKSPDEVDAQATGNPDLTPLVMVADCLPVAMVGSGWRRDGPLRLAGARRRNRRCGRR